MNSNKNKLPSALFLAILDFFEKECEFDVASFLDKRDINKTVLQSNNQLVDISYINELIDEVINKTKDYSILFKLSTLATPKNLGVLGYLMLHSKNIGDALDKLCKYYLLIGKSIKPVFVNIDNGYKISIYSNNEKQGLVTLEKYRAQIHLFAIIHLINNITNSQIKPEYVTLMQEQAVDTPTQTKISGIKIYFNKDENAIYFNKNIKNISTTFSDNILLRKFEKEAEDILKLNLVGESLTVKISGLVLASTSELDFSLESIASKLDISPRVLQKKLKKENTSFSNILEEVRKKLSTYYLLKGVDISTVSVSLGYSELSSFFRAFKKWYFTTPKKWLLENKD